MPKWLTQHYIVYRKSSIEYIWINCRKHSFLFPPYSAKGIQNTNDNRGHFLKHVSEHEFQFLLKSTQYLWLNSIIYCFFCRKVHTPLPYSLEVYETRPVFNVHGIFFIITYYSVYIYLDLPFQTFLGCTVYIFSGTNMTCLSLIYIFCLFPSTIIICAHIIHWQPAVVNDNNF